MLPRRCMFDTNVFNRILDGALSIDKLSNHVVVYATHIQRDELSNTKEPGRREALRRVFVDVVGHSIPTDSAVSGISRAGGCRIGGDRVVPTASAVYGVSRYGEARYGPNDDLYSALRMTLNEVNGGKPNNAQDALIAETAIKQEFTLVTDDLDLAKVTKSYGGHCLSVAELLRCAENQDFAG